MSASFTESVVEIENAADESATLWSAWQQLQTYKAEIASLFASNAVFAISGGVAARMGTLTAGCRHGEREVAA